MRKYVPGIGLLFLGTFLVLTIGGSSSFETRIIWASAWGGAIGALCLIPLLVIQAIGVKLLKCIPSKRQTLILNAPLVVMIGIAMVLQWSGTRPEQRFMQMLSKPVPSSVRTVQQGGFHALDSEFWALRFQIPKEDFSNMVVKEGFERLDQRVVADRERLKWELRLKELAMMEVNISSQWEMFFHRTKQGEKRLFFNPKENECIFVLDTH